MKIHITQGTASFQQTSMQRDRYHQCEVTSNTWYLRYVAYSQEISCRDRLRGPGEDRGRGSAGENKAYEFKRAAGVPANKQ